MATGTATQRRRFVYALTSVSARLATGSAGIAVIVRDEQKNTLKQLSSRIRCASPEAASYHAIMTALREAKALGARNVTVYTDDPTLVGHLSRDLQIPESLVPLYVQARALMNRFRDARVKLIEDAHNTKARRLSELALESEEVETRGYESPVLPLSFR